MAIDVSNLTQMSYGNGFSKYRYDTLDPHATVDTVGYFNNIDDSLNMAVGDTVMVIVWTTAVRSGTISTYGYHIVNAVSASTGIVDLTNVTVFVVTDSD